MEKELCHLLSKWPHGICIRCVISQAEKGFACFQTKRTDFFNVKCHVLERDCSCGEAL